MPTISSFSDYLTHQKRYSLHTVIAYKKDLEQFEHFLKINFEVSSFKDVQPTFIRSWIVHLMENKISTRSINRKISTLKSFYKYLLINNKVTHNPLLKVITPKTSKRLPVFIGEDELTVLFSEIEFKNNYEGHRDKLILELFYSTGIRLIELVNLQLNSFDSTNSTIKVLGKRKKERIIPISKLLNERIINYLEIRRKLDSTEKNLFLTKFGKKIYPKLVYRIVYYYLSMVTTATKKSPHVLRHTFATHMLNNGAGLNSIKELLGHANLSATQVYTHNTTEKLKNIHQQAHPKA